MAAVWLLSCCICGTLAAQNAPSDPRTQPGVLPPLPSGSVLALLPPAGSGVSIGGKNAGEEAVRAVTDALRRSGHRVLSPVQVRAQLSGHTLDGCRNAATCDPDLALATLRADAVISIAVWQKADSPSQVVVHVRRQRSYGQAELPVGKAGLRAATTDALFAALADSQRAHEIMVQIESQPVSADVRVDQTLSAKTPARVSLLPGNHLVSVEAPGYISLARYIEVPEHPVGTVAYQLRLSPASGLAAAQATAVALQPTPAALRLQEAPRGVPDRSDSGAAETSTWNYVVAIALFGAAVPLLANVVYGAATHGRCVGEIDAQNRCAERVSLGPAFFASLGLGTAAVLGGSAFLILRPITEQPSAKPRGAMLHWHHSF
jgi:hypothetical protein